MNYLIFGGKGWIGSMMVDLLKKEKISYNISELRLDNTAEIEKQIVDIKPTNIMCFIGRTHGVYDGETIGTIDYLEKPGKLVDNIRDNLFSPLSLALLCEKYDVHLSYLGTGCIFTQNENIIKNSKGYTEESLPDFFGSSYSIVKGFTDRLMHQLEKNVLNIRIRMPIVNYDNPRNFITKITKYDKICSIQNSMTYLPDLLPIALDMSKNKTTGTINLTNPGTISHNEILELYKNHIDSNFTWNNFTIKEQDQVLLSKRSNNKLNTDKLEKMYPDVLNIKDSVEKCMKSFNRL